MTTTAKRIRFGLVFEGARPPMDDFLREIGVTEAEGVQKDGKQYIVFTVAKPKRTSDVQASIDAYNRRHAGAVRLLPFCDSMVTTFERGSKYLAHPIYQTVAQTADDSRWSWSLVMAENDRIADALEATLDGPPPEPAPVVVEQPDEAVVQEQPAVHEGTVEKISDKKKKKRAISELQMNLVETVVVPSSSKRSSCKAFGKENDQQVCYYGLLCIGMFFIFSGVASLGFESGIAFRLGKSRRLPSRRRNAPLVLI
jgi:hypothetical protein